MFSGYVFFFLRMNYCMYLQTLLFCSRKPTFVLSFLSVGICLSCSLEQRGSGFSHFAAMPVGNESTLTPLPSPPKKKKLPKKENLAILPTKCSSDASLTKKHDTMRHSAFAIQLSRENINAKQHMPKTPNERDIRGSRA